jgi:hypothetical protein
LFLRHRVALTGRRGLVLAWADRGGRSCLRVDGWSASEGHDLGRLTADQLAGRLAVVPTELLDRPVPDRPFQPVAGCFEVDGRSVWFVPRFPFLPATSYSLIVRPFPAAAAPLEDGVWTITRPAPASRPATRVVAVYPTAAELPLNQLKLYVHFSRPMSEGWAASAIHVRRADTGAVLDGAFLPMEPELWDRRRRRLTVLFDPGRIKRGLAPNEEAGYPLVEGAPVDVEIAAGFRDAEGLPLASRVERRFDVGPPERTRVDPARWAWCFPGADSAGPLVVHFDRPLDHALLEHCLWVVGSGGARLAGRTTVGPGERSWSFTPTTSWRAGRHAVRVDSRLEDLAGNSIARVFDRDLTRADEVLVSARVVTIGFVCGTTDGRPADDPPAGPPAGA